MTTTAPDALPAGLTAEQREKLLWRNAAALYGIEIAAPASIA